MPVAVADLRKIVEMPSNTTDGDLQPFIDGAALIVTENLASASLTATRKAMIELYLAAHLAVLSLEHGGITRSKAGESEDAYRFVSSKMIGFASTHFGQLAMDLDTSGTLAASIRQSKALFRVVDIPDPPDAQQL